jgi:hypothetical protein
VPGIGQRNHVINLDLAPALILHLAPVVRRAEHAAEQHAAIRPGFGVTLPEITTQHVITLVAAIAINVSPGLAELLAAIALNLGFSDLKGIGRREDRVRLHGRRR